MKVLILEDDYKRVDKFKKKLIGHELWITHLPHQANLWLEEQEFDFVFLDHDLADEHYQNMQNPSLCEDTGLVTAEFLGNNLHLSRDAQVVVHSLNPYGSERMMSALKERNKIRHPFTSLIESIIC